MNTNFLSILSDCVACNVCGNGRVYCDLAKGVPPRGFAYPDQPDGAEILFVLDQPNRMDPVGRDRLDAEQWIDSAKDPTQLALSVNDHTRNAFAGWDNEVHSGVRDLCRLVFGKSFGQVGNRAAMTNLVKCESGDGRAPTTRIKEECARGHLFQEIAATRPKAIISMKSGMLKTLEKVNGGVPIVDCHHPGRRNQRTGLWNKQYVVQKAKEIRSFLSN